MSQFKVSIAQVNSRVGDFSRNATQIVESLAAAKEARSDLVLFPVGALSGIAAKGFRRRADFLFAERDALKVITANFTTPALLPSANSILYVNGKNSRVVVPGELINVNGLELGVLSGLSGLQADASDLKRRGAKGIIILATEPFVAGEREKRRVLVKSIALGLALPVVYVVPVGGFDELIFEGGSFIVNGRGEPVALLKPFEADFGCADLEGAPVLEDAPCDPLGDLYRALTLALGDYVRKNGFMSVELGLSGGVDSALVASLAVDALGAENVYALMMPTDFTSSLSLTEAKRLAQNLGIHYDVHPIGALFDAFRNDLKESFKGKPWDATEENLQARIRGMLLMARANKFSRFVMATSNKSEAAVGYSTLYGDTCGAFEPIADVLKTKVWELCRWKNAAVGRDLICESIIERAPSAELRENQKDNDLLPDYDVLDKVIAAYVEDGMTSAQIVDMGIDKEVVRRIIRMIHRAEFKRGQIPIVPRVSKVPFAGPEWKFPVTVALQ